MRSLWTVFLTLVVLPAGLKAEVTVKAIAAQGNRSLALDSDGSVWQWGSGQSAPTLVGGVTGIRALSASPSHTLALKNDGTVWAWGWNAYGQLGDGTPTDRSSPVRVSGLSGVVAVAASNLFSLGLDMNGTVWEWGGSPDACCGLSGVRRQMRSTPTQVAELNGVIAISAGPYYSLAWKPDGSVWVWDERFAAPPARLPSLTGTIPGSAIVAGDGYVLALKVDGTLWAGRFNTGGMSLPDFPALTRIDGLSDLSSIAYGGWDGMVASKRDGTVWTWSLGSDSVMPFQVNGLSEVVSVAAGADHGLALKKDGAIWAWGANDYGQLGDGRVIWRPFPGPVKGLTGISAVDPGYLALKDDGTVWAWATGCGPQPWLCSGTPVRLTGLSRVTAVASGFPWNVALMDDKSVWRFGGGDQRFSGIDDAVGITGGFFSQGSALNRDGTVYLLDGNGPMRFGGADDIVAIAGGYYEVLALRRDGTVWWWWQDSPFPPMFVRVEGLTDVVAFAEGPGCISISGWRGSALAVKSDGTVWEWETGAQQSPPVQVNGLFGVSRVAAGGCHNLALKQDGTVWAWGLNYSGQVGDGTTRDRPTPVQVAGLTGVVAIAARGANSLALRADGTVWV
jgi:alpha-tubulin suppressor-like RCC1 family protein